jgi:putative ABC transport system substrate-binding protein
MKRRDFAILLGGVAISLPLVLRAQSTERLRGIGLLMAFAEDDAEGKMRIAALLQQLKELDWEDGRNIRIEYRWAAGAADRTRLLAKELVEMQPDLLIGGNTTTVATLARQTRKIPILFVQVADPVGSGLIESLARPGGNVTGFANFEFATGGKWLEVLKEIAPRVAQVAVVFNPDTAPYGGYFVRSIEAAAPSFSVRVTAAPVRDPTEIERVITAFAASSNGALVVLPDISTTLHRKLIISFAEQHRLPAIYPFRYFVTDGGLISYGVDAIDLYRRTATYVDRILRGANPAELPVQQPTKFEFAVNIKTAKALGLTIPQLILLRADEVIE